MGCSKVLEMVSANRYHFYRCIHVRYIGSNLSPKQGGTFLCVPIATVLPSMHAY